MTTKKIDQAQYNRLISDICRNMCIDNWRPTLIVSVFHGGFLPSLMISEYFNNIPIYALENGFNSTKTINDFVWFANSELSYANPISNILIVTDINSTDTRLAKFLNCWKTYCVVPPAEWTTVFNNDVRIAVVVDNVNSKLVINDNNIDVEIAVDYCGLEITDDNSIEFPYEKWWVK